jgi:3'(2'), 5'-bisphosphate nucleotidase
MIPHFETRTRFTRRKEIVMPADPLATPTAALDAVRLACTLCATVQRSLVTAESLEKRDRSPVTVADYGSQAIICAALTAAYPDIPIVGEEDATALRDGSNEAVRAQVIEYVGRVRPDLGGDAALDAIDAGDHDATSDRYWTLDPIDGTKGFLRGEQYAVALGLIENGTLRMGLLGCPNLHHDPADPTGPAGCLYFATQGGGAFWSPLVGDVEPRPIRVDVNEDITQAKFCESVESGHSSHGHSAQVAERLGVTAAPVRIDSQCKYAAVGRGEASIYLRLPTRKDYQEKIWDHAAGALLIEEAGGRVTDVRGVELDFGQGPTLKNNTGVIATNGTFHDRVVEAVQAVLAG